MAHYKHHDRTQCRMIAVDFDRQILPGSFESVLDQLIDRRFRFSSLDTRYRNDETGAPAFDPRTLLKIILYAYSRGLYSSRAIEEACRTNVTFMALSGCAMPDCTTIAAFVASLGDEVAGLFADALAVCLRLGLVGGRILAIDGCKLASNASREWSGTFSDLRKKRDKLKARVQLVMRSHRQNDRKASRVAKLRHQVKRIEKFLRENEPRRGQRNNEIQSNVTDNESAKIKSSRGMIQGYNGIALVDARHQIEAVIPDQGYRRRDDRFVTARRYKDRIQGRQRRKPTTLKFTVDDFRFNKQSNTYSCPASKTLRQTTASMWIHDTNFRRYAARASDCSACQLQKRCLGTDTARRRNLHIINNRGEATHASRMNAKIDALRGRQKATPNGCSIAWSTTSKRSPTLLISGVCDRAIRAPGPPFAHRPAKNVESPGSDPKSSPRSVRRGRRGQAASNSVPIRQSG